MADRDNDAPRLPSHRAYAVIRRDGQDDFWLNLGLVFPHKDNAGFNIMLQALPLDGKIVCREVTDADAAADESQQGSGQSERSERSPRRANSRRS
jgi:hypothetical protein